MDVIKKPKIGTILYYVKTDQELGYGVISYLNLHYHFISDNVKNPQVKAGDTVTFENWFDPYSKTLIAYKIYNIKTKEKEIDSEDETILNYSKYLNDLTLNNLATDCINEIEIITFNKDLTPYRKQLRSLDIIKLKYPKLKDNQITEILHKMEDIFNENIKILN